MQKFKAQSFTPTEDLKLLFTKCNNPLASWLQISELLKRQFQISKQPNILKHRYEHYLNIPSITNQDSALKQFPFLEKKKKPEDYLQLYRQIKNYHEKSATTKREETYQKQVIKKQLYPNFESSMQTFRQEAIQTLKLTNMDEEYELLRVKPTQQLNQEEANQLEKIEKINFRTKQLRLQNHKKVTKLHRIIRNIISAESRCFAEDILINQMNIGKLLIKVLKNIYHNASKIAKKVIQRQIADKKQQQKNQLFSRNQYIPKQSIPDSSFFSPHLLLDDFSSIQQFYQEESEPLFRKDIIKLYYFPQEKPTEACQILDTADGQKLTLKRLTTIMKMFKKMQILHQKQNQTTEKQIVAQFQEIQSSNPRMNGAREQSRMNFNPHPGNMQNQNKGPRFKKAIRKQQTPEQPIYRDFKPQVSSDPLVFRIPNPHLTKPRQSVPQKNMINNDLQEINSHQFESQVAKTSNNNSVQKNQDFEFQTPFQKLEREQKERKNELEKKRRIDEQRKQQQQKKRRSEEEKRRIQEEEMRRQIQTRRREEQQRTILFEEKRRQLNKKHQLQQKKTRKARKPPVIGEKFPQQSKYYSPINTLTELVDESLQKKAKQQKKKKAHQSIATKQFYQNQPKSQSYKKYLMTMIDSQMTESKGKLLKSKQEPITKYFKNEK